MAEAVARGADSGWLRGFSFDTGFILGILTLGVASAAVVAVDESLFPIVFGLDLWVLGYHHVISTFTRLAFDAESRRVYRFYLYGLPPIVLLVCGALAGGVGMWTMGSIYLYWQWFHYSRQSWGVSQAYRRKSGGRVNENETLTKWAFYSLPVWGILSRSAQDPGVFLGVPLKVIPVPDVVVWAAAAVTVVSVGLWSAARFRTLLLGTLPLAHTLYMFSHFAVFSVSYLLIEDITLGWLVINVWHNAQYILFVWMFNSGRFRGGVVPESRLLSTLSQKQNWLWYFGFCLLLSSGIYFALENSLSFLQGYGLPSMVFFYAAINFHHYIIDGFIWKMRKPALQKTMNLGTET